MSKKMQRLLARGMIHFKDDPGAEGSGGGSGGEGDAAAVEAARVAAEATAAEAARVAAEAEALKAAGGEKMSPELAALLKESMGRKEKIREQKTALEALQAKMDEQAQQLAAFTSTLGETSLDEVKAVLQAKEDAKTKALEDKGEYDRILAQVKEKHEAAVAALKEQVEALAGEKGKLSGTIDEMTVGRSFNESPFIRESSTLPASIARKEFASHFEFKDGVLVGYDKPAGSADRTPLVNGDGAFEPFEIAIKSLYEKHPESKTLIKSTMKPGAGSKPTGDAAGKPKSGDAPKPTGLSKIQASLEAMGAK